MNAACAPGLRWSLVACCTWLSACGFRLAGSDPLPAVIAQPYLSLHDPYTDFAREFTRQLKTSGAILQNDGDSASATIEVTRDDVQQRVLSVSARNIPTEYELTYTVTIAARSADRELLKPQVLTLSRDYSFDENSLLAKDNEEEILRLQMARDLAAIAARRLTSLK